ncbi:hypothetical protein SAMN05216338_108216 [Bradyrhizobium sp. Rc2d]|nr:hypothetical protein SAMN05216338_108216 [Bradyrhizobium sp. Rc2d]
MRIRRRLPFNFVMDERQLKSDDRLCFARGSRVTLFRNCPLPLYHRLATAGATWLRTPVGVCRGGLLPDQVGGAADHDQAVAFFWKMRALMRLADSVRIQHGYCITSGCSSRYPAPLAPESTSALRASVDQVRESQATNPRRGRAWQGRHGSVLQGDATHGLASAAQTLARLGKEKHCKMLLAAGDARRLFAT